MSDQPQEQQQGDMALGPLFGLAPASFQFARMAGPDGTQYGILVLDTQTGRQAVCFTSEALGKLSRDAATMAAKIKIAVPGAPGGIFTPYNPQNGHGPG